MVQDRPRGLMLRGKEDIALLKWQCETMMDTGFLPRHIDTPQKAAAVMMMADELNVGRITALRGMYVIQGKVSCNTQLLLALCRRTGEMEDFSIEGDDTKATCMMKRRGQTPVRLVFTLSQAKKLGIVRGPWLTQAATMLRWRAVASVARLVFPDALEGVYTHEEMGHPILVDDGNIELDSAKMVEGATVEKVPDPPPTQEPPPDFPEERPPGGEQEPEAVMVTKQPEPDDSDLDEVLQHPPDGVEMTERLLKEDAVARVWFPPDVWRDYMDALLKHPALKWPVQFKGRMDLDDVKVLLHQKDRNPKAWSQVILHLGNEIQKAGGTPPKCPPEILKGEK